MPATQYKKDLDIVTETMVSWANNHADKFTVEHLEDQGRVRVGHLLVDYSADSARTSASMREEKTALYEDGTELYYVYPWDVPSLDAMKNHFNSKLGLDHRKVSARRLEVSEITNAEGNAFAKEHHIQKSANGRGKISYGLKDKETGELLAVQQYCQFRWSMKSAGEGAEIWEGLRLVIKTGVHLYGAATRLQNFFVQDKNPTHIVSYVDYSHSLGAYKEKQGFVIDDSVRTQESFRWVLKDGPHNVKIVDKFGRDRYPELEKISKNPYVNPNRIAGSFGQGIGRTFYNGEKLGSRKELKEQGNELFHNDMILEAIGYDRIPTAGQLRWVLKI